MKVIIYNRLLFRFIFVNIFSFIKRFFVFNASIYNTIVFLPLLTVLTPVISKKSLIFVLIFSFILLITGNIIYYDKFLIYFLLLLAIPMFRKVNFEKLLTTSFVFFVIVSLYGISQKIFGYSPIEINWIKSGLSFADKREFLASNDIRPFSTFASMPEFTLFIGIYLYFFTTKKKYVFLLFSLIMLYIAGSRGMIISTLVAYFFTFFLKKYTKKYLLLSFITSSALFLFLTFIFPIFFGSTEINSRMFAYGTFNGRIELIARVIDKATPVSLITGLDIKDLSLSNTFDNLYLMLIAHFGIFGGIYFLFFFINQKIDKKNFYFLIIFLSYGFYADMVFSYYLMFLFFFAIYSYSELINNTNNINQEGKSLKNGYIIT